MVREPAATTTTPDGDGGGAEPERRVQVDPLRELQGDEGTEAPPVKRTKE